VGYLAALLSALLFGANGSLAKIVIESGITAGQLTFLRSLGAAVLAALALAAVDRNAFRISPRSLLGTAILGLVGVAAVQWLYAVAITLLPVGIALLLEYLAVPIVALVAWLVLHEGVRASLWVGIGLVVAGLAVVAQLGFAPLDALGMAVALLAAIALAAYFLIGQLGVATISPLGMAFWSMSFSALFWAVFSGWWTIRPAALLAPLPAHAGVPTLPLWAGLALVIVLGSFAPYLLSYAAIRRLGATRAGVLATAEVVFAFAAAWAFLGETIEPLQLIGAAIVLAGIVTAQLARPGTAIDADLAMAAPHPGQIARTGAGDGGVGGRS
jgi:drug/metabolite transporter (DMT)-like permease